MKYLLFCLICVLGYTYAQTSAANGLWTGSTTEGNTITATIIDFINSTNFQLWDESGTAIVGTFTVNETATIPEITLAHKAGAATVTLLCIYNTTTIDGATSIVIVCDTAERPTSFDTSNCTGCVVFNLVLQDCPTSKVALISSAAGRFPAPDTKQFLLGFSKQYSSSAYRFGDAWGSGLNDEYNSGKFYGIRYQTATTFITHNGYLTEYYARSVSTTVNIRSTEAFSTGLYPPGSDATKISGTSDFAVPVTDTIGLKLVPVYSSLPQTDILLAPQVTCTNFANRNIDFSSALANDTEAQQASAIVLDALQHLTWNNTLGISNLNDTVPFLDVVKAAGLDINSAEVQFNIIELLLPAIQSDISVGNPPLGEANAPFINSTVIDAMVLLRDRFWFVSITREQAAVAVKPFLTELVDWFNGNSTLSGSPPSSSILVTNQGTAGAIGTKLRFYSGTDQELQSLAVFFCFINSENRKYYPAGAITHIELQNCNGSKRVYTEFNGVPTTICGCESNPCPYETFFTVVDESLSINYESACGISSGTGTCPSTGTSGSTGTVLETRVDTTTVAPVSENNSSSTTLQIATALTIVLLGILLL